MTERTARTTARPRGLDGWAVWLAGWLPRAWAEIDRERDPHHPFGWREAGALVVASVGLAVMFFGGHEVTFIRWFGDALRSAPADDPFTVRFHPFYELYGLVHWAAFCVVGYFVVPAVWLKLTGQRLRDCYLGWAGTGRHLHVYLALYLVVLGVVVVVSATDAYQQIYPFYRKSGRSWMDLVAWQLAYGAQFFALEFFFRGFMLVSLRRFMGHAAIFVMVVPYCMLHFGKTFSESLGAIIAGVVLGTMAMRWRSIWGGALLHWIVAISMDVASLVRQDAFPPPQLWP